MNLATYLLVLINLATLTGVVYLLYKMNHKPQTVDNSPELQFRQVQGSLAKVSALEDQFKQSLEEAISKNKLMIQNTSDNLVKYYQDTVTTMTLNYNQNTEKLMQLLDSELKKRIEDLDKAAIVHIQEARAQVESQVKKDLEELNKQVDKYSKERFKQLDDKIYEIVSETAKNSVGKVINLVDHQELVMTALDQAKKDKFFS